ncbi:hypothetical protein [Nocardia sp. NPDC057668]
MTAEPRSSRVARRRGRAAARISRITGREYLDVDIPADSAQCLTTI